MMHVALATAGGFIGGAAAMYAVLRAKAVRMLAALEHASYPGAQAHWADVANGLTHAELAKRLAP